MSCVMGCQIYQSSPCVRETLESGQQESRDCIQRKIWCMGPYAGVGLAITITFSHSQLSNQLSTPTAKGKGWSKEDLFVFAC
jgi:hypothetical protein